MPASSPVRWLEYFSGWISGDLVSERSEELNRARAYLLAWSRVRGIGPGSISRLRRHFGSLQDAWRAPEDDLQASGLRKAAIQEALKARQHLHIEGEISQLERRQIGWITLLDPEYPPLLKNIANPPLVLYWRGNRAHWPDFALAIVGTRKASRDGLQTAREFAGAIADQGYTIVSGLAQGIDAAAHEAALASRGGTIAVLGSGLEEIYPKRNQHLAERIRDGGMVISEFAPKVKPVPGNFPYRNRIISGLSIGVLVAEAPARSGALNTAQHAAEQGRDVFAVPQSIYAQAGQGCNDLLADGALIARNAQDVLHVLRRNPMERMAEPILNVSDVAVELQQDEAMSAMPLPSLSKNEQSILEQMSGSALHVDEIAQHTSMPATMVSSTLTLLEIKGLVGLVGAMQYRKLSR